MSIEFSIRWLTKTQIIYKKVGYESALPLNM
jgi:hypothetical protein